MASAASPTTSWSPPPDNELTWFKPRNVLPTHPRALEFSFEISAFTFGLSRALESLYFPMYEIRPRLISGELYLASVPSAMAEHDLEAQLQRMGDSGLRFTRSVRGIWERAIRREVEEYNERMAAFAPPTASNHDVADGLIPIRRARANQWFAATRAVFAPTVMLQQRIGDGPVDEAREVTRDALDAIRARGSELVAAALQRVGNRLASSNQISAPDDVYWLDVAEVRDGLDSGNDLCAIIADRKSHAPGRQQAPGPENVGPELLPDAPRMYLVREVLSLLGDQGGVMYA